MLVVFWIKNGESMLIKIEQIFSEDKVSQMIEDFESDHDMKESSRGGYIVINKPIETEWNVAIIDSLIKPIQLKKDVCSECSRFWISKRLKGKPLERWFYHCTKCHTVIHAFSQINCSDDFKQKVHI